MAPRQTQRHEPESGTAGVVRRRRRRADAPIKVTDDWPGAIPISDLEVRLIEAFFADLLDELFGPIP
jgi:hypothetical protein